MICQVHCKDAAIGGELRKLLAGDVDWQAVMGALRTSGYRGWISVEPVWYQLFISPWGTGCSRYIHTCCLPDRVIATWQQSQTTGAQPLVMIQYHRPHGPHPDQTASALDDRDSLSGSGNIYFATNVALSQC